MTKQILEKILALLSELDATDDVKSRALRAAAEIVRANPDKEGVILRRVLALIEEETDATPEEKVGAVYAARSIISADASSREWRERQWEGGPK